ncbi:MAG: hypothetical protein JEZ04_19370 [Spirochaetales bacterium]|nr:hypothetical protein [Spirochaetales bacterium]
MGAGLDGAGLDGAGLDGAGLDGAGLSIFAAVSGFAGTTACVVFLISLEGGAFGASAGFESCSAAAASAAAKILS